MAHVGGLFVDAGIAACLNLGMMVSYCWDLVYYSHQMTLVTQSEGAKSSSKFGWLGNAVMLMMDDDGLMLYDDG